MMYNVHMNQQKHLDNAHMNKAVSMVSKYPVPDEIKAFLPEKCTKVRNDNGVFRVYKYKAAKLASGRWGTDSGYLIGKIIPGTGFVSNKRYNAELAQKQKTLQKEQEQPVKVPEFPDGITDVAYGQYAFLIFISQGVCARLKECFPLEKAMQIYSYGLILCANGFVHMDQIDDFYQESYLSLLYQDYSFKMGYTALSNLLHNLGLRGMPVGRFEQKLIDECSGNVAIDGHVIRSCSWENDLAEPGYKLGLLKAPQVNVLIAFDIKHKIPLMYRTYRGSSVDKKSVIDFLVSRSFTNTKFLVDRGFFSAPVLNLMSQNGNCYIIPVPSNDKNFKRIRETLQYTSGEFVYRTGRKVSARIIYYEEQIDEESKTRIIVYKDVDENNSKRKNYKRLIDEGEKGYTQENYNKYCEWWGVYFLQTNTDETASEVYADYKGRWAIETYNNYVKNDADFNDLKFQDYYQQRGFDFIMLVTGLIHAKLNEAVRKLGKSSMSTFDVLVKSGHMRMVREEGTDWRLHNTRTKDLELLSKMGFIPEQNYPAKIEAPDSHSYVQKP